MTPTLTALPMLVGDLLAGDRWIWWLAGLFSCGVLADYLRSFARRSKRDAERLQEAADLGFERAIGQYPYIDGDLCIGCGACIDACPEGDVLGLIGGQAVVVHGIRCVGIAACETACPVGAIEVGLGEAKGRADLPILDDDHQTTVDGLYIAGELGGLSLVRNAVGQGRHVAGAVARRLRQEEGETKAKRDVDHDLVIVGAGPAGLSAALRARELGVDALVLEQATDLGGTILNYPRRKLVHTQPVDIPLHGTLTRGEHSKEELLKLFEGLVEHHGLRVEFDSRVTSIQRRAATTFDVHTGRSVHRSRFVLLALGRRGTPRRLEVPGESLSKVMYQVRDAEQYRDQRILCVGGGDSAVEAAMGLASQPGNEVTLSYRKDRFARIKRRNQELLQGHIAGHRLQPVFESTVEEIRDGSVRLHTSEGERWIDNDYVFILAGGEPPYGLLREAGIRFGDEPT